MRELDTADMGSSRRLMCCSRHQSGYSHCPRLIDACSLRPDWRRHQATVRRRLPPRLVPLPGQTPPPLGRAPPHRHCRELPAIDLARHCTSNVAPCRRPPWPPMSSYLVARTSPTARSKAAMLFPVKSTGR
uniref:Uncharacterized protein n=1 Tax=Oryza meridionalis TaxID=40149 RepID=A0A0E0EUZ0_9ORYZ